jgi:plastocyanin
VRYFANSKGGKLVNTTRRNLFKVAATGGVSAALAAAVKTEARAQQVLVSAPSAATASFGFFPADSTVDRMQVANPGNRNGNQMGPFEVIIKAGGMVNFIIDGVHQVAVYDDGILPRNINADLVLPSPLNGLTYDPNVRIYRGLSPLAVPANFFGPGVPAAAIPAPPQDRIEAVSFPKPGTFLVICTVRSHFLGGMYGFVLVVP